MEEEHIGFEDLGSLATLLEEACENKTAKSSIATDTSSNEHLFEKDLLSGTSENNVKKTVGSVNSTVHSGETDSSDDEEKRNHNSQFNEFGKEIKSLLGNKVSDSISFYKNKETWKSRSTNIRPKHISEHTPNLNLDTPKISEVYYDPIFGIRISNPVISSKVLKERMAGKEAVSVDKVKHFLADESDKDWVIAGVLVFKSNAKTSQKGNEYSIWTLSDLKGDLKTVRVFLFKNAHTTLWKTIKGTVVAILNPGVMDKRNDCKDEVVLSMDNPDRLIVLGQSKDLGYCKSKKKNGDPCLTFVNVSKCEFCIYHVKQEYQQFSRRSDLQSACNSRGLTALRNKVLGKNEVFYAGKSFMAIPASKNKRLAEKDNLRLQSLSSSGLITPRSTKLTKKSSKDKKVAARIEISNKQRARDLERLKLLGSQMFNASIFTEKNNVHSDQVRMEDSKRQAVEIISKLKSKTLENNVSISPKSVPQIDPVGYDSTQVSLLGAQKNDKQNKIINKVPNKKKENIKMNDNVPNNKSSKNEELNSNVKLQEKYLANIIEKNKQSLLPPSAVFDRINKAASSSDEIKIKSISSPSQIMANIRKNYENDTSTTAVENNVNKPVLSGRDSGTVNLLSPLSRRQMTKSRLAALQYIAKNGPIEKADPMNIKGNGLKKRSLDQLTESDAKRVKTDETVDRERYKKIMNTKSIHEDLIELCDEEARDKYFENQVRKEMMEEKMMTTFKIACKAVKCLVCKYTSFSAAELCKSERHPLKVFDAMKRFFKCQDCSNRTVTLERLPTLPCTKCDGRRWIKTSMMRERIVNATETLSVRGGEENFIGSVISDANLNLLVPE